MWPFALFWASLSLKKSCHLLADPKTETWRMASSGHPLNHCFTSLVYTISFQPALICAVMFKETISAVEGGAYSNNTSLWWQEEPTSLIAVLKAWVCTNNVEVMKNCSFCMNPGLCIPQSLCMCVTQVSPQFTSPSILYTLCTAGRMCPGREPHGKTTRSHIKRAPLKGIWSWTFIQWLQDVPPSQHSLLHEEKKRIISKYKLIRNWSLFSCVSLSIYLFILYFFKSTFIFYRYSSKYTQRYHLNDHIQT